MYKLGTDDILRRSALEHERDPILYEAHEGIGGGHNAGKATMRKVLRVGLWCPSLFVDAKEYCKHCDVFQWIEKPCRRDELPLFPVRALDLFDKWAIDFVGPINPPAC